MLWLHVARWPAETYWHFNKVLHPATWLSKRSTVSGSTSPSWHELGQHISWGSLSWREQGGDTKERRSAEDSERKRRHWSVSWGISSTANSEGDFRGETAERALLLLYDVIFCWWEQQVCNNAIYSPVHTWRVPDRGRMVMVSHYTPLGSWKEILNRSDCTKSITTCSLHLAEATSVKFTSQLSQNSSSVFCVWYKFYTVIANRD